MNPEIDITDVRLETESLVLRIFNRGDLKDFNEYAKVLGVGEMAGWIHHQSLEESKEILEMFINDKNVYAIIKKDTGKVIGSLGINKYKEEIVGEKYKNLKCREIGYVLSKEFWERGYMRQACEAVLKYCFEELDLDAVFCGYFKRNAQSKRVNEKLGFNNISDYFYNTRYGTTEDSVMTVLSKEDWHNLQARSKSICL